MRQRVFLQRSLRLLAVAAATAFAAAPAHAAEPPLALDRFDPSFAGDRMFGVQSPYVAGHLVPTASLLLDYAHNPLVLHTLSSNTSLGSIVKNQLMFHANVGLALWNRLALNVDIPAALAQGGDSPGGTGQTFASPTSAQFGDLRLGFRLRLWGKYWDPFQIAVSGSLWVPTGASNSFVSDGKVRGLPQLVAGGRSSDRLVWSVAAGPDIRPSSTFGSIEQGPMMRFGGGVGVLLGAERQWQVGAEMNGAVVFRNVEKRTSNAEIYADARYRFLHVMEAGIGLGPGLSSGIGTPDFRAIAMISYAPEPVPEIEDRDKDGIPDAADLCPDVPYQPNMDPRRYGCPMPDRDHDGIADDVDACPDVKGLLSPDPKKNGCPPPADRDGDGILDDVDACIDVKGIPDADPKKNGCPPPSDRDGDGIPDDVDACPDVKGILDKDPRFNGCPPDIDEDGIPNGEDYCPNEKGVRDPDPTKNGCPKSVRVTNGQIIILQQVQFDTSKATIKKVSDPLLDEVAGVLKDHPEITKLEVQGHTDDRGNANDNLKLSQARAESVVAALVKRHMSADRFVAKGYGQTVPIATNATPDGRAKNRRVQFTILEKGGKPVSAAEQPQGAAASPSQPPTPADAAAPAKKPALAPAKTVPPAPPVNKLPQPAPKPAQPTKSK